MEMVFFWILATVAVVAAVAMIVQRHAARSAVFLLIVFCCLAGLYILMNAQFVGLAQVIIYAGAIVVLFLFVVMLLGAERAEEMPDRRRFHLLAGGALALLLLAGVGWVLFEVTGAASAPVESNNAQELGAVLLTDFMLPFELASVVLLVAIIGAVVLAKKTLPE
jgi:NADH-quinone oxidoreductase subunit J